MCVCACVFVCLRVCVCAYVSVKISKAGERDSMVYRDDLNTGTMAMQYTRAVRK